MKIFIVCSRLGYGGAEHVAVMWANGFADKGHEVTLISNLYEDVTYPIHKNVTVCSLVSSVDSVSKKWSGAIFILRKLIKQKSPDVIIGVMRVCSITAKLAAFGLHIPIVATEHNAYEWHQCRPMPFQARFFKFYLSRFFEKVTVLTQVDKELVERKMKNVVVLPNPLSLQPPNQIPKKSNLILAAGRLDGWQVKGFDVLIKAWGYLMKNEECRMKNLNWRLQIAGTGSEESLLYLKKLCKENGVEDSVDFLGFVSDMESLYKKASVFVLSSRYEGFGLVLIEAMSQGCACIACDHKGRQREIIQNEMQGLCCPPENVEALAVAMTKMIDDDEYRESVRGNAVERSEYYSINNIMTMWEDILKEIVVKKD